MSYTPTAGWVFPNRFGSLTQTQNSPPAAPSTHPPTEPSRPPRWSGRFPIFGRPDPNRTSTAPTTTGPDAPSPSPTHPESQSAGAPPPDAAAPHPGYPATLPTGSPPPPNQAAPPHTHCRPAGRPPPPPPDHHPPAPPPHHPPPPPWGGQPVGGGNDPDSPICKRRNDIRRCSGSGRAACQRRSPWYELLSKGLRGTKNLVRENQRYRGTFHLRRSEAFRPLHPSLKGVSLTHTSSRRSRTRAGAWLPVGSGPRSRRCFVAAGPVTGLVRWPQIAHRQREVWMG